MNLRFPCPERDYPGWLDMPRQPEWRCPRCDHLVQPVTITPDPALSRCALCGGSDLYKKKDFPHALGMTILVGACLASTITYALYDKWLTWAILIGSAAFDGLLYLWVKDVVVCYQCNASHQGVPPGSPHPPFELTIHERYRQERIRKEQMGK